MKHLRKRNGGFTLMELVVTIAIASIVTAAATSVLMLALRVNRQSSDTASQQNTVRALLNTMENAAADGDIKGLVSNFDSWQLVGEAVDSETGETKTKVIFSYHSEDQTISANGTVVLDGVYASNATLENKLLTISVETADGVYSSSIWCRMAIDTSDDLLGGTTAPSLPGEDPDNPDAGESETKLSQFLDILKLQYGSTGEIYVKDAYDQRVGTGEYYSEWYIGLDYDDLTYDDGWNASTPWCACFVSWALDQSGLPDPPRFAEVDNFMAYFDGNGWHDSYAVLEQQGMGAEAYIPVAGDLIFFDWNADGDPQHMGVVLTVIGDTVYTIEGNSAGRVAVRSYPVDDPRILGYGVLNWNESE